MTTSRTRSPSCGPGPAAWRLPGLAPGPATRQSYSGATTGRLLRQTEAVIAPLWTDCGYPSRKVSSPPQRSLIPMRSVRCGSWYFFILTISLLSFPRRGSCLCTRRSHVRYDVLRSSIPPTPLCSENDGSLEGFAPWQQPSSRLQHFKDEK